MTRRRTLASVVAVTALLVAPDLAASQNFPKVIQSELGLKAAPECTLCHETNNGGEGTTKQPFGRTMLRFGAVKKNDGLLITALHQAEDREADSDGDCVGDIDELRAGTSPNVFDKADGGNAGDGGHLVQACQPPELPPLLETGCSVAPRNGSASYLAALSICALFRARRAGRKKGSRRLPRSGWEGESSLLGGRPSGKENNQ